MRLKDHPNQKFFVIKTGDSARFVLEVPRNPMWGCYPSRVGCHVCPQQQAISPIHNS
ncbi:protein of unknown function [Acidithiobacillus ferrivorans]|uniref:Uncharacterized protein n=1 Tax=Acidithiobacillus ferrivorans TaxID=160808 RepID=A0ABY1MR27_9PROT|nr:protein of unknown function [Acidithiobacillus ferrivorans]